MPIDVKNQTILTEKKKCKQRGTEDLIYTDKRVKVIGTKDRYMT